MVRLLLTTLGLAAGTLAPDPAPEFPQGARWLQGGLLKLADLKGRVVVVHFWTYGCINCQRNYPVYKAWQEKYPADKVTVIGVHTPEFAAEKDADRVLAQAKAHGLTFPILLDNDAAVWKAWRTRCWPTIFLIDKRGVVRYHWEGELHPEQPDDRRFADRLGELLAE